MQAFRTVGATPAARNASHPSGSYPRPSHKKKHTPATIIMKAETSELMQCEILGLLYNLYADSELSLNLVPQEIYDQQSAFYPTVERTYGVPLDTRNSYTKTDWEMFVAAIASQETRDMFHSDIAKWINESPTNRALTDLYETETGK